MMELLINGMLVIAVGGSYGMWQAYRRQRMLENLLRGIDNNE